MVDVSLLVDTDLIESPSLARDFKEYLRNSARLISLEVVQFSSRQVHELCDK